MLNCFFFLDYAKSFAQLLNYVSSSSVAAESNEFNEEIPIQRARKMTHGSDSNNTTVNSSMFYSLNHGKVDMDRYMTSLSYRYMMHHQLSQDSVEVICRAFLVVLTPDYPSMSSILSIIRHYLIVRSLPKIRSHTQTTTVFVELRENKKQKTIWKPLDRWILSKELLRRILSLGLQLYIFLVDDNMEIQQGKHRSSNRFKKLNESEVNEILEEFDQWCKQVDVGEGSKSISENVHSNHEKAKYEKVNELILVNFFLLWYLHWVIRMQQHFLSSTSTSSSLPIHA